MSQIGEIAKEWLKNNRLNINSFDGLPGEFHREYLFAGIKGGSRVAIKTPHGSLLEGRAVMRGPAGWVLNLGGSHGTPGIATERNVVWVTGASKILNFEVRY